MTIDEAIEHAEKRSQECNGSKCGQEHLELAQWLRELRCLRLGMPDLDPVIAWLENGCSPRDAAKELRIYQQRMRFNAALTGAEGVRVEGTVMQHETCEVY